MKHVSDNYANYILCRDNLSAVDVKTWYLHAHMFDGDVAAGPVPLLFAANPDVAAASIAAEPAKAHFDLSKVHLDKYFINHNT
jgi:hypothetical protein